MRAGVRSIEHGSLIDDEGIALMKQHGTWLVADIYNGDYTDSVGPRAALAGGHHAEEHRDHRDPARRVPEGGGGGGPDRLRHRQRRLPPRPERHAAALHGQVRAHARCRRSRAPPSAAAQLMQWEDRVGSLAPGKYADIIAVDGDALADLHSFMKVGFVMKGGVVYKGRGGQRRSR